jgi:hypothetical protein
MEIIVFRVIRIKHRERVHCPDAHSRNATNIPRTILYRGESPVIANCPIRRINSNSPGYATFLLDSEAVSTRETSIQASRDGNLKVSSQQLQHF